MNDSRSPGGPCPDWPFASPRRLAVIVERSVMRGLRPIAYVYRGLEYEGFQFLSDGEKTEDDPMVVSLEEVYALDPTIGRLAGLPPGWRAVRERPPDEWVVEPWDPELLR